MKRSALLLSASIALLILSVGLYLLQIRIFHDPHNTLFYLLQDLAFLPVQIVLVTLVLSEVLTRRERAERFNKLNMVIGAFFSMAGLEMLRLMLRSDAELEKLCPALRIGFDWGDKEFAAALRAIRQHETSMRYTTNELLEVKTFLLEQRESLLRLLENPNLLEHEAFTDLLWAISHLTDELWHRPDLHYLTPPDAMHIANDFQRAYLLLLREWLAYLKHLLNDYPYIYSFLVRTNPLDPEARVEVTR